MVSMKIHDKVNLGGTMTKEQTIKEMDIDELLEAIEERDDVPEVIHRLLSELPPEWISNADYGGIRSWLRSYGLTTRKEATEFDGLFAGRFVGAAPKAPVIPKAVMTVKEPDGTG